MEPPLQSSSRKPESPSNTKAVKTVSALDVDMNKTQAETQEGNTVQSCFHVSLH